MPDSDETTWVVALVAVLMTLTETPGIAALVVSSTTPVMLPRSDCAKDRAGVASAAVASRLTIKRLITIVASRRRPGQGIGRC